MTAVKGVAAPPVLPAADAHIAELAGRLLDRIRRTVAGESLGGLRMSHSRLLAAVPPEGITITELSAALSMTKQAVGQFVTQLEKAGHVEVRTDPNDRRRRIVVRSALGDDAVGTVTDSIRDLEQQWADRIGARRYSEFRDVLTQLVAPC
ncbi:MAG: MarR family winged helix-turn-helix transcriptional regulator [Actinomycetota bacterium]|nr:MarR family winged helix-turn-helix transcriptional regulator [Actinomycetota bacterium]